MTTLAEVRLWGRMIAAVSLEDGAQTASFQYTPEFAESRIEVSPITMPLSETVYRFPGLQQNSFHGLPGLLADSLPDKFGNALIDAWLATQGRTPDSFNAIERLCYTGTRGMGALDFFPTKGPRQTSSKAIDIDKLVQLASNVLSYRDNFHAKFSDGKVAETLSEILRVGTSAGGARAKAVIAWNPKTNEVRSGQVKARDGFEHWLLKFDGVSGNKDKEFDDPQGYGAIEYAYYLMALEAGISMSECRLLEENGRRHFMTKRFDRLGGGEKLHMQSLGGIAHFDFNAAGAYSYEQAFVVMRQLKLSMADVEQQFRRMVFNIVARNQDDHVKNIAFLMNKKGVWSLAPAFDVTYSFNPSGAWTSSHQMTVNGKRDDFTIGDLKSCAEVASMKRGRAETIIGEVRNAVERWDEFARRAQIDAHLSSRIRKAFRSEIDKF